MNNNIHYAVIFGTKIITDELTDQELAALFNAVSFGFDPKHVIGYDKVKGLFTEQGGTKMHSDILAAFESIVEQRLFGKKQGGQ